MAAVLESNKTKIAKRVIEVFEYFGADNRSATVMDIVRRYGRPQSSTSELLAGLVEMGLLYKDPLSRSYMPTPRLATLGSAVQPDYIRDGRLYCFMDRLAQSTRQAVALFGMVGTHVQIFRSVCGADARSSDVESGNSELLSSSAAGLMLLSTVGMAQSAKLLWRLNAEAAADAKFNHVELNELAASYRRQGHAVGTSGFAPGTNVAAILLPLGADERPLALGVVYPDDARIDADALVATLKHGASQFGPRAADDFPIEPASIVRAI